MMEVFVSKREVLVLLRRGVSFKDGGVSFK